MNEDTSKPTSATDWARVSTLTDAEIDTTDIPPLDDAFFAQAVLRLPPAGRGRRSARRGERNHFLVEP